MSGLWLTLPGRICDGEHRAIANRNTGDQQQVRSDSSKKVFEIPGRENFHQIPGGSCQR